MDIMRLRQSCSFIIAKRSDNVKHPDKKKLRHEKIFDIAALCSDNR